MLEQVQTHWQHLLRPRLEGLSDEEYFWQPVPDCWTINPRSEEPGTGVARVG